MKRAVALVALAACQAAPATDMNAVIGGLPDDHAAVVALLQRRAGCGAAEDLHCSGILVAPRVVLTAAHCLDERRTDELEVAIGGDIAAASEILAVWQGSAHPDYDPLAAPESAFDLAVLVLERAPAATPAAIATTAPAELVDGATVRVVGFGPVTTTAGSGTRLGGDATVDMVDAAALWTSGGIPCGGDSGGAVFLDTSDGEVLVGVIKASGADCTDPGLAMRVDTAHASFLAPAIAMAADVTASGRPAFDADADHCAGSCVDSVECPLGMLCLPEDGAHHCGYREGRVTEFGAACAGDDPDCVPVGQGSERDCRTAIPCGEATGCCSTGGGGETPLATMLVLLAIWRRRSV